MVILSSYNLAEIDNICRNVDKNNFLPKLDDNLFLKKEFNKKMNTKTCNQIY